MLRQLTACLVVLVAAGLAWVWFVPGSTSTLANMGITLPFAVASADGGAAPGSASSRGGPPGGRGPGMRQTNVVTSAVTLATINDRLGAIGEASAERSATVVSPAGGTLAEVMVRPGQIVFPGDTIARLDADAEQIAYDRAQLAAADANAALERTRGLAQSNVVANTALTAAQLAADTAQLELRSAEMALARRTILSPIEGRVGLIQVTPGNYVPAQTTVTTIDDTSSILVDFWVPERYVRAVTQGMPIAVSPTALPGQVFRGEVSAIDNRVDPSSRTLRVQGEIPNNAGELRAGMSLAVSLDFPGDQYPAVNPLAILWSAEGSYVWKYNAGKAERVMAEIVQRNSDGVLVQADLEPGDAVITEGLLQLSEGAEVNLLDGPDGSGEPAAQVAS